MKNRTEYRLRKIVCAAAVCAMLSPAAAYAADQSDGGQTANAVRKEETVYIFTDATGKSTEVLVNDRLKNSSGEDVIEDVSTLSDCDFSQACDLSIRTEVENMAYELSSSTHSVMYFYDVYLGPEDMLKQPFGEYQAQ